MADGNGDSYRAMRCKCCHDLRRNATCLSFPPRRPKGKPNDLLVTATRLDSCSLQLGLLVVGTEHGARDTGNVAIRIDSATMHPAQFLTCRKPRCFNFCLPPQQVLSKSRRNRVVLQKPACKLKSCTCECVAFRSATTKPIDVARRA